MNEPLTRKEMAAMDASWHSNKFLNPVHDGAVLPILHLNGYKIANPTILARISHAELEQLFSGYGYKPYFVEGAEPEAMHQLMAATMDTVLAEIKAIQEEVRSRSIEPGQAVAEATRILGRFLRDIMQRNSETRNFRVFGPDETDHFRVRFPSRAPIIERDSAYVVESLFYLLYSG